MRISFFLMDFVLHYFEAIVHLTRIFDRLKFKFLFGFRGERMSFNGSNLAKITDYICNLRGGSQPILVLASDGLQYVVKFSNNLQGVNLPFNEGIGSALYRAVGLPCPDWKPLLLTDSFIDQNPDCWMHTVEGRLRPAAGLCFASRFLGGMGTRVLELLPGSSFSRILNYENFWLAWLIDICAGHTDNRQAIFLEDATSRLTAFFVDHGHLFGGPNGDKRMHFSASRFLDTRIYQSVPSEYLLDLPKAISCLNLRRLWHIVEGLPADWQTPSAIEGFEGCLNRLANPSLLQNILDSMVDCHQRQREWEKSASQFDERPPAPVLHPRVRTSLRGRSIASDRTGYLYRRLGRGKRSTLSGSNRLAHSRLSRGSRLHPGNY